MSTRLQQLSYYNGVVDNNDLAYVIEKFGNPKRIIPAPVSRFKTGEHKGRPKINPQVSSFIMKDGRTISVFHVKPVYYLHVNGEWKPLSEVTTYHGNRKLILNNKWEQIEPWYLRWLMKRCELIGGQVLIPWRFDNVPIREGQEIYFTVTTFYPDPSVEVTSVDGYAARNVSTETWADLRGGVGNLSVDSGNPDEPARLASSTTSNQYQLIKRGIFLFDSSSLPDTDTVDSAIFSLKGTTSTVDNFSLSIGVVTSTPASNTAIVDADYTQLGTVLQSNTEITFASWSTSAYNDFSFNATGNGNISKTTVSKFGTRFDKDRTNTEPTWSSNVNANVTCFFAEEAGTASDPKLAVTHSAAATSVMSYFMGSGFWGA